MILLGGSGSRRDAITESDGRRRETTGIARSIEHLVADHGRRVLRLLIDVLGNTQDAEDAYQEAWYAVWRARLRIRAQEDPWPFIRTVALRKAFDGRRRRRDVPALANDPAAEVRESGPPLPELRQLPRRERAALVLYFWEGLSVAEIAEALEVGESTVKTWMFRGRERLRGWLLQRKETR